MKNEDYYKYKITKKVVLFQILYHCELMYDYLTETGIDVPEEISDELSSINLKPAKLIAEYNTKKKQDKLDEGAEFELQTSIAKELEQDKESLSKIFNDLTVRCRPASPCTLENTISTDKIFIWFGPRFIRFIRDLWLLSSLFLIGYIIFGSLTISDLFFVESSKFYSIFFTQLLLFFSGGLGACLYALTTSKRYIVARTFDNKYITHYYNRIIIGLITGFILANIIDASFFNSLSNLNSSDPNTAVNGRNILGTITPSLLALLGGFSAEAVIKILNRLLAMIMTLVEGDTKDIIETKEEELKNKFEAQKVKQNMNIVIELKASLESSKLDKESESYKKIKSVIDNLIKQT